MSSRIGYFLRLVCVLAMPLALGCDSSSGTSGGTSMDAMASALDAQKNAQQEQARTDAERAAQEAAADAEQMPAEQNRRMAGRERVAPGSYADAIIGARRHILNRVESLAWIQGVQHFQATNGRLPKDHAEFMSQIVEPLGIDLGYKEENQEFWYDPDDKTQGPSGTLYVVEKDAQTEPPGGTP